ncbi:MAG: hypothetical protein NZ958_07780 [Bacteroidia bacterium]|nr:hypothetical protein [Bacteroidia bacterium]MDW8088618.1 hypothetical protein [Bacteroidia bacterium]
MPEGMDGRELQAAQANERRLLDGLVVRFLLTLVLMRPKPILALLLLGGLTAQPLWFADTVWYIRYAPQGSDTFQLIRHLRQGSALIRENYDREGQGGGWRLRRVDTLVLSAQGRLTKLGRTQIDRAGGGQLETLRVQTLYAYFADRVEAYGRDERGDMLLRAEFFSTAQQAEELLRSSLAFFAIGGEGLGLETPVLYRREHVGDSLRVYVRDGGTWQEAFVYRRRAGGASRCDTIISGEGSMLFCTDASGYLTQARDTSPPAMGGGASSSYRVMTYGSVGGTRVVLKDSTDSYSYAPNQPNQIVSHARTVLNYLYGANGRLEEIRRIELRRNNGLIGGPGNEPVDTTEVRVVLVYSQTSALIQPASVGCLEFSSEGRWGRLPCLEAGKELPVRLYEGMGRLVWQGRVRGEQPFFQLPAEVPSGVYLLQVGVEVRRVFLQP